MMTNALSTRIEKLGLTHIDRHVFICADATKSLCCDSATGLAAWEYLKNRLRELGLDHVFRTKANCLRVCTDGPILLVYPEGVWYQCQDEVALNRIVTEHLEQGQLVEDLIFHKLGEGDIDDAALNTSTDGAIINA